MTDLSPEAIEAARLAVGKSAQPATAPNPRPVAAVPVPVPVPVEDPHVTALLDARPKGYARDLAGAYLGNEVQSGHMFPEQLRAAADRASGRAVPGEDSAPHIERLLAAKDPAFHRTLAGAYLENEIKAGRMTHDDLARAAARPAVPTPTATTIEVVGPAKPNPHT